MLGDPRGGAAPLREDGRELSGGPGPAPGREVWRYPGVVVFIGRGRVLGFAVTDQRAQTRRGVGIGDSLAVASRQYRDLYCNRPDTGYRSAVPGYLYCVARPESQRLRLVRWRPHRQHLVRHRLRPVPVGQVRAASCPQAASMSRPRVSLTVALTPRSSSAALNAAMAPRVDPLKPDSVGL